MRDYRLKISEQAQHDLVDIWLYIANNSSLAADNFVDLILEKCRLLCSSPSLGRSRDELFPGIRSLPFKRYIIYYRVTEVDVEIVRLLSGYRDTDTIF
ncbi:MAG: type II toxin-antitoxin system RelE/ParE family toxin [Pseudomonadota bacterium]|nr:type II toxin-antitoxin system RelE/ParE family toxin [Pseudomonadota bacterium]